MGIEVIEYKPPRPPMTSRADGRHICPDISPGPKPWLCTREIDHDGDHEAGSWDGTKIAQWPQESGNA